MKGKWDNILFYVPISDTIPITFIHSFMFFSSNFRSKKTLFWHLSFQKAVQSTRWTIECKTQDFIFYFAFWNGSYLNSRVCFKFIFNINIMNKFLRMKGSSGHDFFAQIENIAEKWFMSHLKDERN